MSEIVFGPATPEDAPALLALLQDAGLPSADVRVGAPDQAYVVARDGGEVVGCVGLELYGQDGLLRSLAVAPALRGRGLGEALYQRALAQAALRRVRTAYLLTTTAEGFFARRGFERVARADVPAAVAGGAEFRRLCPASAACLRRRLEGEPRHLPADALALRPSVPGATFWAVALERAMLTYFEVAPHARFERHAHEAEQITLVLEGELFFELPGAAAPVRVGPGEVMALPAGAPHAASAGAAPVKAVDAWSPPRPDLLP